MKNLRDAQFDIATLKRRQKPCRTEAYGAERKAKRNVFREFHRSFFAAKLGAIIDNKAWRVPKPARGRNRLNAPQARFHLRKHSKGLKDSARQVAPSEI